ncbi:MAG TPA: type II secretion system protein [Candidatus Saccharimonadales bacterium]|nr:type II secretion system protein [Candidatus Saccharimonadales bacterium]
MNVQQKNKEKGFTIIEVVLVLAIAALIFLMVFIALPALQRSQRDTQRKNDMSRVQTAIQNFQSNNRNKLPGFDAGFISSYLTVGGDTFADPNGTGYSFTTTAVPDDFAGDGKITYTVGSVCDGEALKSKQGANKVAIQYKLEGGGIECVSN